MNYINIYIRIIKTKYAYSLILFNKTYKISYILFIKINNIYKLYYNLYFKQFKKFLFENGLNNILLNNWYKFGVKYNIIYNILFNKIN